MGRGAVEGEVQGAGMSGDAWQHISDQVGQCASWLRDRVDSSPKPDAAIDIQIDRVSALVTITRMIPSEDSEILTCVCGHGNAIGALPQYRGRKHERGKEHLAAALERLADVMERIDRKSKRA